MFPGTRVKVWILFKYLADGRTVDDFLTAYKDVPRQAVLDLLDDASRALIGQDSHGEVVSDALTAPTSRWGEWGELRALVRDHANVLTDENFADDLAEAHALTNALAIGEDPWQP